MASILRSLGVAQDELQELANMNGRDLRGRVDKGEWTKVVR